MSATWRGIGCAFAVVAACFSPAQVGPFRIVVTPGNSSFVVGDSPQITAIASFIGNNSFGSDVTQEVVWTSSDNSIVAISNSGLISTLAPGTVIINAARGPFQGATTLTVIPAVPLSSIAISPVNPSVPKGINQQFVATATFADNTTQNVTAGAAWASSDGTIATIAGGLARTHGVGSTTIQGTFRGVAGSTTLTVSPPVLQALVVEPTNPTVPLGINQQFSAIGVLTDGTNEDLTANATWSSSNNVVANVSSTGLVVTRNQGAVTITAIFNSFTASTRLTVGEPIPQLDAISKARAWSGSGPMPITLSGANFGVRTVAHWNGSPITTSLIDSTHLSAIIPVSDLSAVGTFAITVFNPPPAGGTSAPLRFDVAQTPPESGYVVGVDYHAYTKDFNASVFITQYTVPGVRSLVRSQLQGIANEGGKVVSTRIWLVTPPGGDDGGEKWRAHFPLSDQERANLRAYAQDVAAVVGAGGNHLQLEICLLWLGAADYTIGSPSTSLGYSSLTAAEFTYDGQLSIDKVLAAVSGITRSDGAKVVQTVYMDGEIALEKPNIQWFLSTEYPAFTSKVLAAGLRPSAYLQAECTQDIVLDNGFTDSVYPILNGHRSIARAYRMLHWMSDQGLYLSPRTDFDCYPISTGAPVSQLVTRVLDDADATFPSLGVPKSYAIPETSYWLSSAMRRAVGQAWADDTLTSPRLRRLTFWTTPNDNDGLSDDVAYPFVIQDYLP